MTSLETAITYTDEELVARVRAQDKDLYSEIVKRYEPKLYRYAMSIVQDRDKALDVVQDTFIKAYVNLQGFNTKKSFSSWIYRILHNEALNAIKKHHRETKLPEGFDAPDPNHFEQELSREETAKMVRKCLQRIPVKYAEPVALYYLEEKSYEEISDILQLPIGTIGARINRAKKAMRQICQEMK
ncbi:MAG: RNA polymerase sigma factor [Actinomycetota bacterium]